MDRIWLSTVPSNQYRAMNQAMNQAMHQAANSDDTPHLRPEFPLIWRARDKVHFGDHPVPITLDAHELTWLASLKSHRSWRQARAACPSGPERADRILALARAAQALDEPGECWWLTPKERSSVRGELLALANWHQEPGQALAARAACAIAVPGSGPVHAVISSTFEECGLRISASEYADVVVVMGRGHIDAIDPHEEHAAIAHVPIRIHNARAAIGPVVVPGRTPCCRCLSLHARDRDAAWPAMAAQWRTWTAPTAPDRLLTRRVALEAVTLVRRWIDTATDHPAYRIHLELPRLESRWEQVTAHDACGCLWQSARSHTDLATLSA